MEKGLENNGSKSNLTQQVKELDAEFVEKINALYDQSYLALNEIQVLLSKRFGILNAKTDLEKDICKHWDDGIQHLVYKEQKKFNRIYEKYK